MYRYSFCSTIEVFFYSHNIYSQAFCSKWIFSRAIFVYTTFPDLFNSRTFPGPGKLICYFPGRVGTSKGLFSLDTLEQSPEGCSGSIW